MANKLTLSAVGLLSLLAAGTFAQTATTAPVGFVKTTIPAQSNVVVGVPMVNAPVATAAVSSVSASTITLSGTGLNLATLINDGREYYVEIKDPAMTYDGDRFEINETTTIAQASGTIMIDTAAITNTMASVPTLTGCSVLVRPHVTIGQIFGTQANPIMSGGTTPEAADTVSFFANGTWNTYFFYTTTRGTLVQEWRSFPSNAFSNNTPIPSGVSVLVSHKKDVPVSLAMVGAVRTNGFARPLAVGTALVADGFPVAMSLRDRGYLEANGFKSGATSETADNILVWNGLGYDTYFLLKSRLVTVARWVKFGDAGNTDVTDDKNIFSDVTGCFLVRRNPDPNFYQTIPYSLN